MPTFILAAVSTVLIVFSGLRLGVGSDYDMYARLYSGLPDSSFADAVAIVPQEWGFVGLMLLCRRFSEDPRMLFTVAAALTVVPTMVAIRRLSSSMSGSIFLYFFLTYYTTSMNSVRQSIAVAFMFLGESYRPRSKVRWLLLSAAACTLHSSAVIALVVQLCISGWRPRARSVLILLGVIGPILFTVADSQAVRDVVGGLNGRYDSYYGEAGGGLGTTMVLVGHVVLILFLLARKDSLMVARVRYLPYVVVSGLIMVLALSNWVFARLEPYFGIYFVVLIPDAMRGLEHRREWKLALWAACLVYFGFHTYALNGLVPYQM